MRGQQPSGVAIGQVAGDVAAIQGQDGQAVGARLGQRHAVGLHLRGGHEQAGGGVRLGHAIGRDRPTQADARLQPGDGVQQRLAAPGVAGSLSVRPTTSRVKSSPSARRGASASSSASAALRGIRLPTIRARSGGRYGRGDVVGTGGAGVSVRMRSAENPAAGQQARGERAGGHERPAAGQRRRLGAQAGIGRRQPRLQAGQVVHQQHQVLPGRRGQRQDLAQVQGVDDDSSRAAAAPASAGPRRWTAP